MVRTKRPAKRRKTSDGLRKDVTRMKKMMQLNQNVGRIDFSVEQAVSTTAVTTVLNAIAGGTDDNQRLGNKINLLSLQYRFQVIMPLNTEPNQVVAWYLFYDKQTNGASPNAGLVLENINSRSFPNWEYKDRFTILRSWHRINPASGFDQAPAPDGLSGSGYIKLGSKATSYTGTGGNVDNIATGGLFLLVVGDDALSAGDNPTIWFQGRVVYTQ